MAVFICFSPSTRSASNWLWARQSTRTFSTVVVPPFRQRHAVVELEPARLAAAVTVLADERAASAVALPHLAPDRHRDVAALADALGGGFVLARAELLVEQLFAEQHDRPRVDRADVA
ncbi:MAG: hypothetical protein U0704_00560 [Candidatus Eisenbacteria bacterium]